MGINVGGIAAAYQGFTQESERQADAARREQAAQRADKDAAFQEETRGRQRADWRETDRLKQADKDDRAAVDAKFAQQRIDGAAADGAREQAAATAQVQQDGMQAEIDRALDASGTGGAAAPAALAQEPGPPVYRAPAAPAAPADSVKLAPAVAAKVRELRAPAGIPGPRNFNDVLERQSELLRMKSERGDLSPADYAQQMAFVTHARNEGINEALASFAAGDAAGGIAAFNRVGKNQGARLISSEQGTTKINGQDAPTHIVTLANPDGSHTVIDATKAQFQLLDLNSRLTHADRATQVAMQREHYAGQREDNKAARDQAAKDSAAGRALQAAHLNLARMQFDAATPFGQIAAKEKALGQPLTPEQRATMLGLDTMPVPTRMQLNSLLKAQDEIEKSLNKAQADGSWQPDSPGGKQLTLRSAILNQQISDLMRGGKRVGPTDPAGLFAPAAQSGTVPNPFVPAGGIPAAAPLARPGPVAAPAGIPTVQPVSNVAAKALGLTGGHTDAMTLEAGAKIEAAAKAVKDATAVYAAVAQSGDPGAIATYQKQMETARESFNALVAKTGNREDAVRDAVGL